MGILLYLECTNHKNSQFSFYVYIAQGNQQIQNLLKNLYLVYITLSLNDKYMQQQYKVKLLVLQLIYPAWI